MEEEWGAPRLTYREAGVEHGLWLLGVGTVEGVRVNGGGSTGE